MSEARADLTGMEHIVSQDFTFTCECGETVTVVGSQEQQPHTCRPISAQQVRDAWAAGYEFGREEVREVAARLEQDQAEALRIVRDQIAPGYCCNACDDVARILSPSSLADYEALGSPVGDEGGNDE